MSISLTQQDIAKLEAYRAKLDLRITSELDKEVVDNSEVMRMSEELEGIDTRLQQDSVGDASSTVDVTPTPTQEAPMAQELTTEELGLTPDTPAAVDTLTASGLGLDTRGKGKIYRDLTFDAIKDLVIPIDGSYETYAGLVSPTSILDKAHMIVVPRRDDIKKAARGLALQVSGAIQDDGSVVGTKGDLYTLSNGNCTLETVETLHTLDGEIPANRTRSCPGIPRYRGNGNGAVATKKESTRCLHMWAIEFELGFFVVFKTTNWKDGSNNQAVDSARVAIIETAGDAEARKWATAKVAEWQGNRAERQAINGHVAAVHNHARNLGVIGDGDDLPPVPEVADFVVEDVKKPVKEVVSKLGGRWFYVDFIMPMKDGDFEGRARARSLSNLAQVLSGRINAVRQNGQDNAELRIVALTGVSA